MLLVSLRRVFRRPIVQTLGGAGARLEAQLQTLALNLGGQLPSLNVQKDSTGPGRGSLRRQAVLCPGGGLLGDEQPWRDTAAELQPAPEPADCMLKG